MANGITSAAAPRIVNLILGVWLFISAFLWVHTQAQMTNTWILGILAVVFSLVAMYADARARYLTTILSIWLFISVWALPRFNLGTAWNNVIVAILMFVFSLMPGGATRAPFRRAAVT